MLIQELQQVLQRLQLTELIQLLNLQVVVLTMAKFAKIGLNNKVIDVVTVANEVLLDSNSAEDEKFTKTQCDQSLSG